MSIFTAPVWSTVIIGFTDLKLTNASQFLPCMFYLSWNILGVTGMTRESCPCLSYPGMTILNIRVTYVILWWDFLSIRVSPELMITSF